VERLIWFAAIFGWLIVWGGFESATGIKLSWFGPIGLFLSPIIALHIYERLYQPPPPIVATLIQPGPAAEPYHWWQDPGCLAFVGATSIAIVSAVWYLFDPGDGPKHGMIVGSIFALAVIAKTISQLAGNG